MTMLVVITVTIAFVAFMLLLLGDVLRLFRGLNEGKCHCTRYRLCDVCLAELREDAA